MAAYACRYERADLIFSIKIFGKNLSETHFTKQYCSNKMQDIINAVLSSSMISLEATVSRRLFVAIYDCFNMRPRDYLRRYESKMKYVEEYYYEELDWFRIETVWNADANTAKKDFAEDRIDAIPAPNHPYLQLCSFEDLYTIFLEYNPKNKYFSINAFAIAIIGFISGQIECRDLYIAGPKCGSKKVLRLRMFPEKHSMMDGKFVILIATDSYIGEEYLCYKSPVEIVD